jgi:hypothetical protein
LPAGIGQTVTEVPSLTTYSFTCEGGYGRLKSLNPD